MEYHYHPGEISAQTRAGVREQAIQIGKIIYDVIPVPARNFLIEQRMIYLSSFDHKNRVWASVLFGNPGFMEVPDKRYIRVNNITAPKDPLLNHIKEEMDIGLLAIQFSTRRRMRANGTVTQIHQSKIDIRVNQVYSNCQKYIQAREEETPSTELIHKSYTAASMKTDEAQRSAGFSQKQREWIEQADTFFIASACPGHGADISHRGGNPGFVKVTDERSLVFPDYQGNSMFNTLGNLAAFPGCGLLFLNFEKGDVLQITGEAVIDWDSTHIREFPGAQRLVRFEAEEIIYRQGVSPLRWRLMGYSPFNPE